MKLVQACCFAAVIVLGLATVSQAQVYVSPYPVTTYYAPSTAYYPSTPVTTYYAPTTAYYAPTTSYYAPTTAYYAPAAYYAQPVVRTSYYVPRWQARRMYRWGY
ncbi:MAG: hypothetical protein SGJ20_21120 [Planctomycetota bacterium]|nr:hypothetical protein [Planctomycetota bacterium]